MVCTAGAERTLFVMADSKLVNEHRAWLKDAEKGKTRACIIAATFFVYNAVMAFTGGFTGFYIFLILLLSLISALCIFWGKNAGRILLVVTEIIIIFGVASPFFAEDEIDFVALLIAIAIDFWLPLACLIFTYANFYVRRYFTFMVDYKANKIYL